MLFGPKRDGFAEEVIITEFSNEVREPRKEKTAPPKIVYHEEKPADLLDYLPIPSNVVELPPQAGTEPEEGDPSRGKKRCNCWPILSGSEAVGQVDLQKLVTGRRGGPGRIIAGSQGR